MTKKLTLIRGLPGSGKSTLAKTLQGVHLEADMYFVDANGRYQFNRHKLSQAHQWCQKQTDYWLKKGKNVVVANTFVRHWEMSAYKKLASKYNAELEIIVCREKYQSIHDVSDETIERMRQEWQE